MLQLNM